LASSRIVLKGIKNPRKTKKLNLVIEMFKFHFRWLLEVNASPSLAATDQWDYNLKYALLEDVLNVLDLERR
jgi:hypothetical protein